MSNKPTKYEYGIVSITKNYVVKIVDDFGDDLSIEELENIISSNLNERETILDELGLAPYETQYYMNIDERDEIKNTTENLLQIVGEKLVEYER